MDLFSYYSKLRSVDLLTFMEASTIVFDGDGKPEALTWNEDVLGPKPSDDDLAKILAMPAPAPTPADLAAYAKAKQAALLAAGGTVNVAAAGAAPVNVLCDGTSGTRADLALLALFGQQSPTGTKLWLDNNGVATTLTGTQLVALTTSIGIWIAETYATLATVLAGIAATPATITATAEVDAAFAGDTTA